MSKFEFSEQLLDTSFAILVASGLKSDYDQAVFDCVCEVCKTHGISVRKYLLALSELGSRLQELGDLKDDYSS